MRLPQDFDPSAPRDPRRHGRLQCHSMSCPIGEILDISASGFRVLLASGVDLRPGQGYTLPLSIGTENVEVGLRVMWVKKKGFRRREAGLEFAEITPEIRQALLALARQNISDRLLEGRYVDGQR